MKRKLTQIWTVSRGTRVGLVATTVSLLCFGCVSIGWALTAQEVWNAADAKCASVCSSAGLSGGCAKAGSDGLPSYRTVGGEQMLECSCGALIVNNKPFKGKPSSLTLAQRATMVAAHGPTGDKFVAFPRSTPSTKGAGTAAMTKETCHSPNVWNGKACVDAANPTAQQGK